MEIATSADGQMATSDALALVAAKRRKRSRSRSRAELVTLVLTDVDVCPGEGWNYVFGLARAVDGAAVASSARTMGSEAPDDVRLLFKVSAHEICHLFGLKHCKRYTCLMNATNSLDELEAKPYHLCPPCLRKLAAGLGADDDALAARAVGLGR
ncbi:archaemetzincin [Thecamonas trahens ATCC 50062]|uniref:Archaemetzincin n=1 Tax=Thecamonas trahens ATCC 50062 TaxID=461836 RepID=A0A0L0DTI5_THETB|nr:archaemetzincin [Thecamonas trahens ATCC 50062]KNC55537.1 archaemetzincin [Thecamonas trahens ATCC 50062]|eukprot:XP_013761311.1 archaemetzincin [Thecamonas trahens ATCC 50062]